ncbi:MAG: hypothetical protein LIR50_03330 [Bacillota bacterium]|nr:hypothetical protein [Bacillota bacterium]
MISRSLVKTAKTRYDLSFSMLENMIEKCPDGLWNEKKGGFVFWQQLLHTFTGINFWMRANNDKFSESFADKKVYPELDHDPENQLTKEDLTEYKNTVKEISRAFFDDKDDEWLGAEYAA